ncbi:MAG: hypothetical protein U0R24_08160 [Solirubrobacterales bacterium]
MPVVSLGPAGRALALGLAVALPASALLAGCGDSEQQRYGDELTAVAEPLNAALIDLGNAIGVATSRGQIEAALDRSEGALESAAADLGELDPPEDAAAAQADLIAAVEDFEGEVKTLQRSVRNDGDREFQRALQEFTSDAQAFAVELGDIRSRLGDAGVTIGDTTDTAG